ncbi:NmrA family transcriptional regulator [Streptomyces sp. DSM 44917]|uniref:NmrA family transcriptional regulator n=1 Tax=Streptomyces boetiae TaxID=3075541 RepID=A0ABU2LAR2_9ACTN|nr:NmrA family transcriptional regulator [Streptomyces sp. DSM 44917]MDT0308676.1 NmrA family transcriptional regulator [Streptomyces sp. DSM 44917]
MTETTHASRILITSGTGKTGRRLAARLPGARVASRSSATPFDWTDPATWAPALTGAEAVYLAYHPDITAPEAAAVLGAFARRAADLGTRRIVLLSGRGMTRAAEAEEAVRGAGVPECTVLRASWFSQNFSEEFLVEAVRAGEVALPSAPGVAEPFLDAEDIADAARAALAGEVAPGTYELTGPRPLTFEEAAAELSAATGREIRFRAVSPAAYAASLPLPPEVAALLTGLFTEVLDGRNAGTAPDLAGLLPAPPREFAAYARATAATGVWAG